MRKLVHIFVLGTLFFFTFQGCKDESTLIEPDRVEVIMRRIGHNILLSSNDSISLVRPIDRTGDKYRIKFESNFSFLPDDLVNTIDSVVKTALPYEDYLVQVQACETNEVVYSYEINQTSLYPEVACKTREQPEACYEIVVQFIPKEEETTSILLISIIVIIVLACIGMYVYFKNDRPSNGDKIVLGAYLYDPKNMTLTLVNNTIELTSKESELLNLLYESVNETIDRDTILNKVWGDEGDYVGRTLDVYVSKLRKKLENDSSIQLKNIRGIGYKLIVEL